MELTAELSADLRASRPSRYNASEVIRQLPDLWRCRLRSLGDLPELIYLPSPNTAVLLRDISFRPEALRGTGNLPTEWPKA